MKDDGGPAFPHVERPVGGQLYDKITGGGMSLRDYFAAAALQGFLAGDSLKVVAEAAAAQGIDEQEYIIKCVYQIADAMLAERNKTDSAKT